jgi:DtxR family Mn-dependent transcriptional regulator
VIGLEYEEVHDEACRWEHVMSERVERRIVALLHDHATSPYGNPIPGLAELGVAQPTLRGPDLPLTSVVQEAPHRITVTRISEPLQADRDQLASLSRSGLLPGVSAQARRHGGRVLLAVDGRPGQAEVSLSEATAAHIFCGAGEVETAST